jgi:hypothetical protein
MNQPDRERLEAIRSSLLDEKDSISGKRALWLIDQLTAAWDALSNKRRLYDELAAHNAYLVARHYEEISRLADLETQVNDGLVLLHERDERCRDLEAQVEAAALLLGAMEKALELAPALKPDMGEIQREYVDWWTGPRHEALGLNV